MYTMIDSHSDNDSMLQVVDQEAYNVIQQKVKSSPADFWGPIAKLELHWFHDELRAWLRQATMAGDICSGWYADTALPTHLQDAWQPWTASLDETNAPVVCWFKGGKTNAAFNELDQHVLQACGQGTAFISESGGEPSARTSIQRLLIESTLTASVISKELNCCAGDRLAIFLPNEIQAIVWMEAVKRIALPYVAIATGTSSISLADRIQDTGAVILVTSDNLVHKAQEALHLLTVPPTGILAAPSVQQIEGWRLASTMLHKDQRRLFDHNEPPCPRVFVSTLWSLASPLPVDACYPLFVLYTSGSTGKPKGIVHTHGGYQVGMCATTRIVFSLEPRHDVLFVIASPGWITGQSYMIASALLCRVPSVLLEGSPVSPQNRVAAIIERQSATVLKAGSTFLRMLMTMPDSSVALQKHDMHSLRLGTFCAEPVNKTVHTFARGHFTPNYINSYWATEHGGIVWSRCHGNDAQPLRADTRTWPLPWITGEVVVPDEGWRVAAVDEQGEVVIRQRYPYQALTVWQSEMFGTEQWLGDAQRWDKYFQNDIGYLQGDAASCDAEGGFTFHGRSDEVINVGGNRIGTEEIESALLVDVERIGSPLRNCVVVGMPHEVLGTVPVAFVVLQAGIILKPVEEGRLCAIVQSRLGAVAVPAKFVVVDALPETHSGKYMRRLLKAMLVNAPLGDLSALKNPECVFQMLSAVKLYDTPASQQVGQNLIQAIGRVTGLQFEEHDRFMSFVDSLRMQSVVTEMRKYTPAFDMTLLMGDPTIAQVEANLQSKLLDDKSDRVQSSDVEAANGLRVFCAFLTIAFHYYHYLVQGGYIRPPWLRFPEQRPLFTNPIRHLYWLPEVFMLLSGFHAQLFLAQVSTLERLHALVLPVYPLYCIAIALDVAQLPWCILSSACHPNLNDWYCVPVQLLMIQNIFPGWCWYHCPSSAVKWYVPTHACSVALYPILALGVPRKSLIGLGSALFKISAASLPAILRTVIHYSGLVHNSFFWSSAFPPSYSTVFYIGMVVAMCSHSMNLPLRLQRKIALWGVDIPFMAIIMLNSLPIGVIIWSFLSSSFLGCWLFAFTTTQASILQNVMRSRIVQHLVPYTLGMFLFGNSIGLSFVYLFKLHGVEEYVPAVLVGTSSTVLLAILANRYISDPITHLMSNWQKQQHRTRANLF